MEILQTFTDGSFNGQNSTWAFIIIKDNKEIFRNRGKLAQQNSDSWQINGELQAIKEAVIWAKINNYKIIINYDLKAAYEWVCDLFGKNKPWKTNKPCTKEYRKFIEENKCFIAGWNKVKAHSGDRFNETVDAYAKATWN